MVVPCKKKKSDRIRFLIWKDQAGHRVEVGLKKRKTGIGRPVKILVRDAGLT